ncbi:MAG: peptidylprolyl isomerase [Candidatus Cloacimonetes bacterium]|nr:peptidylprolyl isomerase [Candidatus Cloacimonadota bacterium]
MFESMRKHATWIIYVIAGVFILSMAIGGITSIFNPKPYVGKIAGTKIHYTEYNKMLENQSMSYRNSNPDKEIDDRTKKQINDQTWNNLVTRLLFEKEIKRRRLKVTDQDVMEKLKNPGDDIKGIEDFQTNGIFDYAKYEDVLINNERFAQSMEAQIRGNLPYEKLVDAIKAEVAITEDETKEDFIKTNDKADAKIIFFDSNKITEKIEVTEDDEKKYYEENKEDYKRDPSRKYKYIKLVLEPSEADKNAAKNKINEIYIETQVKDADFAELAIEYSQDSSASKDGDLGFFGHGKMVKEFDEVAFNLDINEIGEPVKSQFGWHIIKTIAKRKNDKGEDEVQASHILIKFEASEETKQNLEFKANDIYEKALEKGLEEAGKDLSYKTEESREFFKNTKYISGIGQNETLVEYAFKNKLGDIASPVKAQNKNDYIVAEISSKLGEHYQEFSEVQNGIKRKIERERKIEMVKEKADEFVSKYEQDNYLKAAEEEGWEVVDQKGIIENTNISKIRKVEELNKAILNSEEGKFTELIKSENGAYIAFIEKREKPDMEKFETDKEALLKALEVKEQTKYYNDWYNDLKKNNTIEDNRGTLYHYM